MTGEDLDTSSRQAFFESAEALFEPDGPGRVLVDCSDAQIVDVVFGRIGVDIMSGGAQLAKDGALFVVPTPAGIVAVRRAPPLRRVEPVEIVSESGEVVWREMVPVHGGYPDADPNNDCGASG